jgi:hypothetical protein
MHELDEQSGSPKMVKQAITIASVGNSQQHLMAC